MKTRNKVTTLFLLTALITTTAIAQNQGPSSNIDPVLINSDPTPLQSGEQGDLRFKLVNEGDTEISVEVQLLDNYPFQVKEDRQRSYDLGEVVPGQEYQISTEVVVADDAPDGSNNFKARIISGDLNRTVNIPVEVQSQDIELNLANLDTQPQSLMPDTDNNQINIDLVNNGEKTAENVVLNLDTPGFFEQTSSLSNRKALGNIASGEVKTASFNFDLNESAPAGLANMETMVSYSADDSTNTVQQSESFQVNIEGKPQFQVNGVETGLNQGSTGEIRLSVENTGSVESSTTRIRVMDSSDQPFSYDSSSQYIGTLEPGQEGEAVFTVTTDQDATAKDYLIDFEVRGTRNTEVFVEDETVESTVKSTETQEDGLPIPLIAALAVTILLVIIFRNKIKNIFSSEETGE
jgi:hypothetical protein